MGEINYTIWKPISANPEKVVFTATSDPNPEEIPIILSKRASDRNIKFTEDTTVRMQSPQRTITLKFRQLTAEAMMNKY